MIKLLKESTFRVKEVLFESISIILKKYIPIASLCFLLFTITTLSSVMSLIDFGNPILNIAYKVSGLIVTIVLFFVFYLFLFKYILGIVDKAPHEIFDRFNLPTGKQVLYVIFATLLLILTVIVAYLVLAVLIFPFVNLRWIGIQDAVTLTTTLGGVIFIYLMIKIAFFPFFIIDRYEKSIESIKMSFALTKGNFLNVILLFGILLMMYGLYMYLSYMGLVLMSMVVNLLTSFVVVPLSSVVLTVAYRNMMNHYKEEIYSDLLDNII